VGTDVLLRTSRDVILRDMSHVRRRVSTNRRPSSFGKNEVAVEQG
jgi:hypothetical protein